MTRSWTKQFFFLLALLAFGYGLGRLCDTQTKGFRARNIAKTSDFHLKWDTSSCLMSEEKIQQVLRSPFYFLAAGGSSDTFVSKDGDYVIKFVKAHRICPAAWASWRPLNLLFPSLCKKEKKRKLLQKSLQFNSYKMSLEVLPHQTGVVYLHLNPTNHLTFPLTFYDNLGIKHRVLADETVFILQKKAEPFSLHFKQLLSEGRIPEIKQLLSSFASLMKERALKRIYDQDITPRYNVGILDSSLILFDIDQLRHQQEDLSILDHMMKDSDEMFLWVDHKHHGLALYFKEEIQRIAKEP